MVSVQRFYRLAIWIPLVLPGVILLGTTLLGLPTFDPLSAVAMTLLMFSPVRGSPLLTIGTLGELVDSTEKRK